MNNALGKKKNKWSCIEMNRKHRKWMFVGWLVGWCTENANWLHNQSRCHAWHVHLFMFWLMVQLTIIMGWCFWWKVPYITDRYIFICIALIALHVHIYYNILYSKYVEVKQQPSTRKSELTKPNLLFTISFSICIDRCCVSWCSAEMRMLSITTSLDARQPKWHSRFCI